MEFMEEQKLDFVQLQNNYIDWEQAKKCLEIANKYEKPATVSGAENANGLVPSICQSGSI